MYNILVVDDSALMRKLMCDIINDVQGFSAVDVCSDGDAALSYLRSKKYDAATINMHLPRKSGLDVLRVMKNEGLSVPVVAISSTIKEDRDITMRALEAGAVDLVIRPYRFTSTDRVSFEEALGDKLKTAVSGRFRSSFGSSAMRSSSKSSEQTTAARSNSTFAGTAKHMTAGKPTLEDIASGRLASSISSTARRSLSPKPSEEKSTESIIRSTGRSFRGRYGLVALACSTGGPQALHTMVPMLPGHLGVPFVIVQHMPKGFTASLAERLDLDSKIHVKEAEDNEVLKPDWVYIAPGGRHLQIVERSRGVLTARVFDDPPVNNLRPCADVMYESLLEISMDTILCVVLTGMGADGTQGISELKKVKNIYTITQDEATCVVYGMPKAAYQGGVSDEVAPITQIASCIKKELGV
ncbi:MAG: chemotaxis-specific protein-glutamate methyltransferase CheB [Lachnospiraceae bacterium]|nr:chemotaxis-specific protein-glutamate methyltransferase CheB [Lachnospiraceae bacterium]